MQSLRLVLNRLRGDCMDKAKQKPAVAIPATVGKPQINSSPTITSSGSMVWSVRDILFGPNRSQNLEFKSKEVAPPSDEK
jgi:hypothetical protein